MPKTATKKTAKQTKAKDNNLVEARPIGEGKDPLAEGNTLVNPTNSEAETHYQVKERSDDVRASEINGQDANERAEQHNAQTPPPADVPNGDNGDQDAVAEGRTEDGEEPETETTPEAPADEPAPNA